ncbi:superfamily II DNA or RNA helicase [Nocardia transvalensis]|uniref:Superfamily II DNA or RNA helicase n=1 Tax=Nocardia transvalensis TaxID=37333 RepID=A0A7W9PAY5_9NOCA|nr:SNF2-related protein [Nocardia transvalensis]MBB5912610.1 superfamily II DNA or RNA helicase [Nocardia transvalensis]
MSTARSVIHDVEVLIERAAAVLRAPEALRTAIRHQLAILVNDDVIAQLRRCDLDKLRPFLTSGVRLGALSKAGYRTVADVLVANPLHLTQITGVGPRTAEETSRAARQYESQIRAATTVRIDPQRRTPGQTRLLALLAATRHADSAFASLREPLTAVRNWALPLIAAAQPAAMGKWRRLFVGRDKRDAAVPAVAQLRALLADPRTESLRQAIHSAERDSNSATYDSEQLWRDYLADAASANSLLSTLGGAGESDDIDAAHGFIEPELRQEISAVPLDTSQLKATLRKYQLFGTQYAIHQQRTIIGDEMGLGKTVQALAVFTHMAAKGQRRFMVVCPASVQINWLKEIRRHTQLAAHSLHGRERESNGQRWLRDGGVAVTTFSTLGSLNCLQDIEIAMLVLDEAHYVKNPDTQRSQHVKRVSGQSQRLLFLTGTPMENRVEEFRNLVGYLDPALAAKIDPSDAPAGARHFRRAVAPVYLRRNQEDVLTELPEKIEVEEWVQLSSADENNYRAAVSARNIMRMRRAAFEAADSAKLERLTQIVDEAFEEGRKVIIFSYFLDVLATIRSSLGTATVGPLTGSVAPSDRQIMIDDFTARHGPAALLSQIDAGGVGLNIQAASVVIIAEPQWKPSSEDQAVARAHRMGQTRKVQVYRLLAKGSVDERIREILEHKQLLFDEFARKSDAKNADPLAVDGEYHRPAVLDDESVPRDQRVILAERHRLGLS